MYKCDKKKILYVINNLNQGGAERLAVEQINHLCILGHEIYLLTLFNEGRMNFKSQINLPSKNIFCLNIRGINFKSIYSTVNLLKKIAPDCVVSHLFLSNTIVRISSIFLCSRPDIITYEHNVYTTEKKTRHLFVDVILSFLSYKIVAVSKSVKDYLISNGISSKKIEIIENGKSTDFLDKLETKDVMRKKIGLSREAFVLVSVGNVTLQKGHDILIEAMKMLVDNGKTVSVVICGSTNGQFADYIKHKIASYDLVRSISLLGSRDDVLNIVNCADVFVMPSRWEGLSIALIEAMIMGKAIIASDIPSIASVVINGNNGLLFPVEDYSVLSQIINKLLDNPESILTLGKSAEKASHRFTIEKNVKHLLSLIDAGKSL